MNTYLYFIVFRSDKSAIAAYRIFKNLIFSFTVLFIFITFKANAQNQENPQPPQNNQVGFEIYGFAMTDMGYNVNQINPNWFDALRVTRLPKYKDQFAPDGQVFFSVRQTRFGVKSSLPTSIGDLKAVFEFDMFGVGVDEGQTTIRPRHFYGELGRLLVGQTNSPFMDDNVFPNTIEYWGPTGMVFYRNVQIRYAFMKGENELFVALERPGASADKGSFEERIELDSVKGQLHLPDLSAHYKRSGAWGSVQLAGMLRQLRWKDIHTTGGYDLGGHVTGWGLHLSTVLNFGKSTIFRGSIVHGEGIENYMNDAPIDVGIDTTNDTHKPVTGKALPITGWMAYLEHNFTPKLSTTIGYSATHIENTDFGASDAYKNGQYATLTFLTTPFQNFMAAVELQYGKRENFNDGFHSEAFKVQLSFKYNFSQKFYREPK